MWWCCVHAVARSLCGTNAYSIKHRNAKCISPRCGCNAPSFACLAIETRGIASPMQRLLLENILYAHIENGCVHVRA